MAKAYDRRNKAYNNMKARVRGRHGRRYVDAGITICPEWDESRAAFEADMGPHPGPGYSLERIDNTKGYSPTNCEWRTMAEQARNRSSTVFVTIDGVTLCLKDMAARLGVSYRTVLWRMRKGMDAVTALTQPFGAYRKRS